VDEIVPTNYTFLISFVMWLYSGFFSLGSMAGEIDKPKKTYT